jgi:hypothetical protein
MDIKLLRGIVVDNVDTTKSGRVKVRIFELHGLNSETTQGDNKALTVGDDELPWAEVMQPIDFIGFNSQTPQDIESFAKSIDGKGSKSGAKTITHSGKKPGTGYNRILAIGTWVFCLLDEGNPNKPVVIGTIAAKGEYTNSSAYRVYDSQTGHYEEFNDDTGEIIIHNRNGNELIFDSNTNINSNSKFNSYAKGDYNVHTDSNSNKYVSSNETNTIKGNQESTISGNQTNTISGNQTNTISGNLESTATGNLNLSAAMVNVKGSGTIMIKAPMLMLN